MLVSEIATHIHYSTCEGHVPPTLWQPNDTTFRLVDFSDMDSGISPKDFLALIAAEVVGSFDDHLAAGCACGHDGFTDCDESMIKRLLSSVIFMTRKEYAATLARGEFEEEEMP
jgi:hypothetical protein